MAKRELKIQITGDTKDFSRAMSKASSDAGTAGKNIARGLGVATAALGAGLAVIGKNAISTANDINESMSKNTVLFGSAAKEITKFASSSATAYGISRKAALEYAGTIGGLLEPLGKSNAEQAKMSKRLVVLAADMASFNNSSIEESLDAIRSGLVGETEPLRRFGVQLNDAALRAEAMRMGLIKTTKEALTPQQKTLASYNAILKQTKVQQGDSVKTGDQLAGQMKRLQASISDTAASIGMKLLPFATKAVRGLNGIVKSVTTGEGPLGRFTGKIGDLGSALADKLTEPLGKAKTGIADLVAGIKTGLGTKVVTDTVKDDRGKVQRQTVNDDRGGRRRIDVTTSREEQSQAQKVGAAIRGVFDDVVARARKFGPVLQKAGKDLLNAFAPAVPFFKNVLLPILKGIGEGVMAGIVVAFKLAVPIIKGLSTALGFIGEKAKPLKGVFEGIGNVIGFVLGGPILGLLGKLPKVGGVFKLLAVPINFIGGLVKGVGVVFSKVPGVVGKAVSGIGTKLKGLKDGVQSAFKGAFGGLAGIVASAFNGVKAALVKAINAIIGLANKAIGAANKVSPLGDIGKITPLAAPRAPQGPGAGPGVSPGKASNPTGARPSAVSSSSRSSGGPVPLASASAARRGSAGSSSRATARASGRGSVSGDTDGLNPELMKRLRALSAATGIAITVRDGKRTYEEQAALVRQKGLYGPNNRQGAAAPGTSNHETGNAADISPQQGAFRGAEGQHGLAFNVPGEPWHIEAVGVSSRRGSSRSRGPSKTDVRARNQRIARARISPIIRRARPGIVRLGREITGLGTQIETGEHRTGVAERRAGFTDEDLATPEGRATRVGELTGIRGRKQKTLDLKRKRRTAINKQIKKYRALISALKGKLKGAKRGQRGPIIEAIARYQERIADLKELARSLGFEISDAKLDVEEIDAEIVETGTPPAAEAPAEVDPFAPIDLALAQAEGTETKEDDIAAFGSALGFWEGRLGHFQQTGDVAGQAEATRQINQWREAIKELTQATVDNSELLQAQLDVSRQVAADYKRIAAVAMSNSTQWGQIVAGFVSGELGRPLGLGGRMLSAAPGQVSRL